MNGIGVTQQETYQKRLKSLQNQLVRKGVDAFFSTDRLTQGYLQGYSEDAEERLSLLAAHADGRFTWILPELFKNEIQDAKLENVQLWRDDQNPFHLLEKMAEEWDLRSSIIGVDDWMPAKNLLEIQNLLPGALFKSGSFLLDPLTEKKSPDEIELMKKAAWITDQTFNEILGYIRPGMSEIDVQRKVEMLQEEKGGTPSFCIVAAGRNSAVPHHTPGSISLREGDIVLLDFGCTYQGYHSDMTRTVSLGPASEEAKKVYHVVYQAHMEARKKAKKGIPACELDRAAREIIQKEGYGENFFHRLGHGVGLRLHEGPYLSSQNLEPLQSGNCFSIEPGIYLPGEFGVRIENLYYVDDQGAWSLNQEPTQHLIEIEIP